MGDYTPGDLVLILDRRPKEGIVSTVSGEYVVVRDVYTGNERRVPHKKLFGPLYGDVPYTEGRRE